MKPLKPTPKPLPPSAGAIICHKVIAMRFGTALFAMAEAGSRHASVMVPLGALAGDLIGSVYENFPIKEPDFQPLFHEKCCITDDSVLTIATMHALLNKDENTGSHSYADAYRKYGRQFPDAGYGASFIRWFQNNKAGPYNSWGNGSAM